MNKVIFDGECPVCATLKDIAEDKTAAQKLSFIPYQSADFEQAAPTLTRAEAKQALYVVTENGKQLHKQFSDRF